MPVRARQGFYMKISTKVTYTRFTSPMGPMLLAASEAGLVGVWFDAQRHMPDTTGWQQNEQHPVLNRAALQLSEYFAGIRTEFDLPLDWSHGTLFQQSVWRALLTISRGRTTSYGELSQRCGHATAIRAVGSAIGRNPFTIVVPCHRVLGKDGSLTGYAGGLERKASLLRLEGAL